MDSAGGQRHYGLLILCAGGRRCRIRGSTLIQRRMTGQIAGMAGAYGNVGAVCYLTVLSFVDYSTFFMVIGASAGVAFLLVQFMDEPSGQMAEVLPDGTVQLINVD